MTVLKFFRKKNEIMYLDSDIKSTIKRLDINKDVRIDLFKFHFIRISKLSLLLPMHMLQSLWDWIL